MATTDSAADRPPTKAIVALPEGKVAAIKEVPVPKLRDEWVLVKVKAVALNPTDWKHIDFGLADAGARIGCDYAGIVEDVGSKVTKFKKGDRIAGFVHGGNRLDHDSGSFGEYLISKAIVQMKIPDNLTFEQASTIGVSVVTCGQGLYKSLKLPPPNSPAKEPFPVLIHGGSTATGLWGIQYAKASGLTVIATSSPSNFDLLRTLGADAVFDYNSPTCGANICKFTQNKLKYAWDCAGGGEAICAGALSDAEPSKYGAINQTDKDLLVATNPLVEGPFYTLGYYGLAEPFIFNGELAAPRADEIEFATMFFDLTRGLLEREIVKPIEPTVNKGGSGLEGVMKGLDELRHGRVRGTKLVYTL